MEFFLNPSESIERIRSDKRLYRNFMIFIMLVCIFILGIILTRNENSLISQYIMIGLIIVSAINIFMMILENSKGTIYPPKGFLILVT